MPMKQKDTNPKERIMETASRLFLRQGYQATGINQVIQEAGVARASLYLHYESKEKLCVAFLNRRHDTWFAGLRSFTDPATGPKEKILAAFDFLMDMNKKEHYAGCAFMNMVTQITEEDEEIRNIIKSHKNDLKAFLENIMQANTPVVQTQVYLLFESALFESKLFREQWPVQKAKEIVNNLL